MAKTTQKLSLEPLSGFLKDKFPNVCLGIGIVGLLISLFGAFTNAHQFYFSYLSAFVLFNVITLGAMFFVIIQHISRAGWSVLVRRIAEQMMSNIGLMAIFFIPIFFGLHDLYHWTHLDAVAKDPILTSKAPYLNVAFFAVRAVVYFLIWLGLARFFYKNSVSQDETGDETITLKMQKWSALAVILFALTITFSSIDWVMSLTSHWYSTIFGVYFFATGMVGALALMILIILLIKRYGYLVNVTIEHIHDLGKLLYGFNIFWAYIAFSQFLLIWYANIPEETAFYHDHLTGSWRTTAMLLAIGHFGVPFLLFMSKHARRNVKVIVPMMIWMIAMTYLDIYWIVMPNLFPKGIHLSIYDLTTVLGIGGVYFAVLFKRLSSVSLVPSKDPRIDESLKFTNL